MNNSWKRLLLPVLAFSFLFLNASPGADETSLLKVRASVIPKRLARGQEGKIQLRFTLAKGITINHQPAFTIEMSSSEELAFPKDFFTSSDLEIEIKEEDGREFLNLEVPVSIPFTVKLQAQRGSHMVKGKIKYFASSYSEGWCLKETTEFSSVFFTSNRIAKK